MRALGWVNSEGDPGALQGILALRGTARSIGTERAGTLTKVIHLTEITCKTFVEEMKPEEHRIVIAWLQGYYLPEHDPPVIDIDKLSSDSMKLRAHCLNSPEDDLLTAAEAVFGN